MLGDTQPLALPRWLALLALDAIWPIPRWQLSQPASGCAAEILFCANAWPAPTEGKKLRGRGRLALLQGVKPTLPRLATFGLDSPFDFSQRQGPWQRI